MDHDAQQLADKSSEHLTTGKAHLTSQSLDNAQFPKSARLLSPKQFQFVFAKAQKFSNRHWTFIVRPNHQTLPRLGLAIAKKQLAKSVWRNRVKRLARETFRQHKQALSGYDIVVLGRRGMQEVDNETLCKSFEHLIRQLKKRGRKPVEGKK